MEPHLHSSICEESKVLIELIELRPSRATFPINSTRSSLITGYNSQPQVQQNHVHITAKATLNKSESPLSWSTYLYFCIGTGRLCILFSRKTVYFSIHFVYVIWAPYNIHVSHHRHVYSPTVHSQTFHRKTCSCTIYRRVKFRQRRLNGSLILAITPKVKEKFSMATMLLFCILQTTVSSYKRFIFLG
jgi:hypothetical protein